MFELKGMGGGNECLKRRRPFILRPCTIVCMGGGIKSLGCNSVESPPPLLKFAACFSGMKGGGKTLVLTRDGEGVLLKDS